MQFTVTNRNAHQEDWALGAVTASVSLEILIGHRRTYCRAVRGEPEV